MSYDRYLYINNSHEEEPYISYDVLRTFKDGDRVILYRCFCVIGY